MRLKRGLLITFEGIDGCGKTTQIQKLIERIGGSLPYILVREPGGTPISEKIRDILLDKNHPEMEPYTELLLYAASRHQLCRQVIKPAINEGKIVICDRFYDSTTAYQGYGRRLDLDFIRKLNEIATEGLHPDLTFILDISLQEREKRIANKVQDRLESGEEEFQQRVIKGFREIARLEPERVVLINGMREPEVISLEIWEKFNALLKRSSNAD